MKSVIRFIVAAMIAAAAAKADITNQTVTVQANFALDLDNGAAASSGGDLLFTGSSIAFQGKALGLNLGVLGANGYNNILSLAFLQGSLTNKQYNATPVSGGSLVVDEVFGVYTNGANFAKVWIHAVSAASITVEYTTFGGNAIPPPPVPAITAVLNNSSLTPPGFSNSGIAPSTLFVIQGANLAAPGSTPVLQDTTIGLPATLNGASLSVSAGGKIYTPAIYYSSPTQIAAVMPAAAPVGPATLTVTNAGTPSAGFNFNVVATAFGVNTYGGNEAVLTDATSGDLITPTNSAKPGQIVILWGTGLGADSADSDTKLISAPHSIGPMPAIYVGGVQVEPGEIAYSGASAYPGVHVIGFTIPQGVPNGCAVPFIVVTGGSIVSNTPVAAVMDNGGTCLDPQTGVTGTQISALSAQSTFNMGSIVTTHETAPGTVGGPLTITDVAIATFQQTSGPSYGSTFTTPGTCTISQIPSPDSNGNANALGLDPGALTVTPPSSGTPIPMVQSPGIPGSVYAKLPPLPAAGGALTFSGNGAGTHPPIVGAFTATVNFPAAINWLNQSASASVSRAAGQTFTWSGGAAGSYIIMTGQSSSPTTGNSGGANASYTCVAPASSGQFTVPPYILSALPPGTGGSTISLHTSSMPFFAAGLDYAFTVGAFAITIGSDFQ